MVKAVVDSNVWVSALLTDGTPRRIINHFEDGLFTAYYPSSLLEELMDILSKPRLVVRIHPEDLVNLIALIEDNAYLVEPEEILHVSRDPDDDVFLACAVTSKSEYLVTGDGDLLSLGNYDGGTIVTPAQFLQILERSL